MPAIHNCGFKCVNGVGCVRKSDVCDGFEDCGDGSDELLCDITQDLQHSLSGAKNSDPWYDYFYPSDVSSTGSKANAVTRRYPKRSTTPRLHRPAPLVRTTTTPSYRSAWDFSDLDYDDDWSAQKITIPPFEMPTFKMPTFKMPTLDPISFNYDEPSYSHGHHVDASAPATAGGVIFGILFLSVLLAVCRVWCRRAAMARVVRIQSQHPSTSTQALIAPERIVTDGGTPASSRVVGRLVLRRPTDERQVPGRRTILVRARSTNDLRSDSGQQRASSAGGAGGFQQQQQQRGGEGNERAQRTTDALHLMVRDGPWLTTRTLRPMIPDQPNIPLFIEQSNIRRLDDNRGIVVSTPPQLMMYVDGEFVWIPASRVPEALNFIALLNLQTEEGPSPAAPEHIQDLPTVSIQQETVDTGGRCNVCLEDFNVDEPVRELPCHHLYHSDCIVPWLQLNGTCPACREPISSEEQDTIRAGDGGPTSDAQQ